jgi:hypothetical protein
MDKTAKIVDDPAIREIYSNRIASASYDGAVVTVAFACMRNVPERIGDTAEDADAVVNNRWCIPETVAVELHGILGAALEKILARKTAAPASPSKHEQVLAKSKPN